MREWLDAQPVETLVMLFGFGWLLTAFVFTAATALLWPKETPQEDPCQNGMCPSCFPCKEGTCETVFPREEE